MRDANGSFGEELKQVSCAPECGFLVRSHDEREIKRMVMEHVKGTHHSTITGREVEARITAV